MAEKRTLQHAPVAARVVGRIGRHLRWARSDGVGRLIEEDNLDPRARLSAALARRRWRREHPQPPGSATTVLLVGVQRSGTNMVVRGLEQSPEFEVHNENDRQMFSRYLLRDDAVVRAAIERSRQRFVLLKPLCDSHRTPELLAALATTSPARALWAYRSADGRARSAVAKFGDANRQILRRIAAGDAEDSWQAQRLSDESREIIGSFDFDALDAVSAAALFWYVRNSLYFDLGLDRRDDVALVSYDAFVADPPTVMGAIAEFLGIENDPALSAHVAPRATEADRAELEPRIRALCTDLELRLGKAITK
ncbi:MAG: hypothetical protein QOI61_1792 [Actinomycetota bacterium]|jgi:hypothetical protein